MTTFWNVLIVILLVLVIALALLYYFGRKAQKKQAAQQEQLDAAKQVVSMLVIDKKRLKIKESGLPQIVIDNTPWYMRGSRLPIVKAKVGPKIMTLISEASIFDTIPVKKEIKAVVSGIYITEIKNDESGKSYYRENIAAASLNYNIPVNSPNELTKLGINGREANEVITAVGYYNILNIPEEDFNKAKKVKDIAEMKTYSQNYLETMEKSESFVESVTAPEQPYTKLTKSIEKAITNHNAESVRSLFTNDGYQMFQSMLASGNCKIIATPSYKFLEFNDVVLCRSIPLRFDFNGNASLIRNLSLRINKESGLVESIAFQLTDIAESDILSKDKWSQEAKLTLLNFLEDYQTAYALKRRDYLNQIFSDNALIIIGSVFRESKKSDMLSMRDEVKVKYDTLSKSQFITRLNRIFDNNEFVNLKLADTQFNTVNGKKDVIGVEVKQEYLSSTYGDIGYLFLMVDLRGEKPLIHVRTWQPKETPVDEKINAHSFIFE